MRDDAAAKLKHMPRISPGIPYVPTTIGAVNPIKRSATAKFIRRKVQHEYGEKVPDKY